MIKKQFSDLEACGLNSDWGVQAWYLGTVDGIKDHGANLTSGGHYLLDSESDDGKNFVVVVQIFDEEDNGHVVALAEATTADEVLEQFYGPMTHARVAHLARALFVAVGILTDDNLRAIIGDNWMLKAYASGTVVRTFKNFIRIGRAYDRQR